MHEFKNSHGKKVDIFQEIKKELTNSESLCVYIGTDSQLHKKQSVLVYVTCVVLHRKGSGGVFFLKKLKEQNRKIDVANKLNKETWLSLETAMDVLKEFGNNIEIVIHVDCNKSKKYKSGAYMQQLVGTVAGQGFKCVIKPDAWAAQSVADKFSKNL